MCKKMKYKIVITLMIYSSLLFSYDDDVHNKISN